MTTDLVRMRSTRQILSGIRYEALVPDTLDLAERAQLAINAMTGAINEELDYEYCWHLSLVPPELHHHTVEWFDCNTRAAESLPYFRLITGSDLNADIEENMIKSMLSRIGDDGLYYNAPYRDDAPWRKGGYCWPVIEPENEDFSPAYGNGQMIIALLSRYQAFGDPGLLESARKMAHRLMEIAIDKEDYVYFPLTKGNGMSGYCRNLGWLDTDEPLDETSSPEGAVTGLYGSVVRGMSLYYRLTGDNKALEFAGKLVRYILKPQFWMGGIEKWGDRTQHVRQHGYSQCKPSALFQGHLTCLSMTLHGLIDYASVANDAHLKAFVRQAYEYMRNFGLSRIGMWGENMVNNMMASVAIKLADAGVGDYWEDVDQYARNTLVEDQFVDAALLHKLCQERDVSSGSGKVSIERLLGCLRWHGVVTMDGVVMDPTQNGVLVSGPYLEPLYFVWESILRVRDNAAQVNLLLNRVSPHLDVESHLPYEGKVVIRNKRAEHLSIRIPSWVNRNDIRCRIGNNDVPFHWVGNYLTLGTVRKNDEVVLEFPMIETRETCYLMEPGTHPDWHLHKDLHPEYVMQFKGNDCIKIEFTNADKFPHTAWGTPPLDRVGYPVYQREHYRGNKAPLKNKVRYIAPNIIDW